MFFVNEETALQIIKSGLLNPTHAVLDINNRRVEKLITARAWSKAPSTDSICITIEVAAAKMVATTGS